MRPFVRPTPFTIYVITPIVMHFIIPTIILRYFTMLNLLCLVLEVSRVSYLISAPAPCVIFCSQVVFHLTSLLS
ncbi:hypothetical protein BDR03DRAFT_968790 [Suillus americanus]|nr:hypothetical protein BDR03DRAFT_968790 [Suillus americanus]